MEQNTDTEQTNCFLNYLGCVSQGKKKSDRKRFKDLHKEVVIANKESIKEMWGRVDNG